MEEHISPSSSSSPPPQFYALPQPAALQNHLHCLLTNRPEWWAYAIFWRADLQHKLSFGDGHFRGTRDVIDQRKRPPRNASGGGSDNVADWSDAEWFYTMSLPSSFSVMDVTLPARSYNTLAPVWLTGAHELQTSGCDRSREAQQLYNASPSLPPFPRFLHNNGRQSQACTSIIISIPPRRLVDEEPGCDRHLLVNHTKHVEGHLRRLQPTPLTISAIPLSLAPPTDKRYAVQQALLCHPFHIIRLRPQSQAPPPLPAFP